MKFLKLAILIAGFLCCQSVAQNGGMSSGSLSRPILPTLADTAWPTRTANHTLLVGNAQTYTTLQAAINAAVAGDDIIVDAGFADPNHGSASLLSLPNKSITCGDHTNANWIVIKPANWPVAQETQVTPSNASSMYKLNKTFSDRLIDAANGASCYMFIGLEAALDVGQKANGAALVFFGDPGGGKYVDHVYCVQCYIHGNQNADTARLIELAGSYTGVVDSWFDSAHNWGNGDNQVWLIYTGPGPYKFVNNEFSGNDGSPGEDSMFGGTDSPIAGDMPSDIEIRRNHYGAANSGYWATHWFVGDSGTPATASGGAGSLSTSTQYFFQVKPYANPCPRSQQTTCEGHTTQVTYTTTSDSAVALTWSPTVTVDSADPTDYDIYYSTTAAAGSWSMYRRTPTQVSCAGNTGTCSFTVTGVSPDFTSQTPLGNARWSKKNIFEYKTGRRSLVDGNIFEYSWVDGQNGYATGFTPRDQSGGCPQCSVTDLTFTNNIIRHFVIATNFRGYDDLQCSFPVTQRWLFSNNLWYDDSSTWGTPSPAGNISNGSNGKTACGTRVLPGPYWITFDHNTFALNNTSWIYQNLSSDNGTSPHWTITNNLVRLLPASLGVTGDGLGGVNEGNVALGHFPQVTFTGNVIEGRSSTQYNSYAGNFFPANDAAMGFVDSSNCWSGTFNYANCFLTSLSTYHNAATDGTDIGAIKANIDAAQAISDNDTRWGTRH